MIRFNHVEITVPAGFVAAHSSEMNRFFVDLLGFEASAFPGHESSSLVYKTDPEASQFIFIAEHEHPLAVASEDHLGFHFDTKTEVEAMLERCLEWKREDDRLQIRDFGVLDLEATSTRAFYVRYLLPIWFDIQHIAYKPGFEQAREWHYIARTISDTAGEGR